MGTIPLVALAMRRERPGVDPVDSYNSAIQAEQQQQAGNQQLESGQQQLEAGALQLDAQKQAAADQQTVMRTVAEYDGDLDKALPKLAGKVTPQTFQAMVKFHLETKKTLAETADKELAVQKDQHDRSVQLLQDASQIPDDQYLEAWPTIAQRNNEINPQHPMDPAKPLPKAQLPSFGLGLQTQEVYLRQETERRQKAADQETARHNQEMEKRQPITEASLAVRAASGDPQAEAALKRLDQSKRASRPVINNMNGSDVKDIADGIQKGDQPPTTTGLYRNAGPVRAELARRGVPLAKMETDWKATQRYIATLNGTQQTRLRQAISTASDSLDKIDALYNEFHSIVGDAGFRVFNKAALGTAKRLPGRAGAVATALDAQIADLTSELGNVYMGGNSPTDHSLNLAAKNLSSDWNRQTFEEALKQARLNIGIRKNSIMHAAPAGLSGDTDYFAPQNGGGSNAPPAAGAGDFFSKFGGKARTP